jgi:defect-in-organelle-trafficking protein DotC
MLQDVELVSEQDKPDVPELRAKGVREAALSYGARGGLASRSYEINRDLEAQAASLDRTFSFRALALTAPGGALVVPPTVTQATDAAAVSGDGQAASVARRVYRIVVPGKIALMEPNWRAYLVRRWERPTLPPHGLRPRNRAELRIWETAVAEGWGEGRRQADSIFQTDVDRLSRDHVGMTLYHMLVQQGVITEFHIAEADRGITGGGNEMRVGDRSVRISVPARLNSRANDWQPVVIPSSGDDAIARTTTTPLEASERPPEPVAAPRAARNVRPRVARQ